MSDVQVPVEPDAIEAFCKKWRIVEFSLFGSVVRKDFGPESDVDVLVTFADDAGWSYWDLVDALAELRQNFGRPVEMIEERSVRNPFRRRALLRDKTVIFPVQFRAN